MINRVHVCVVFGCYSVSLLFDRVKTVKCVWGFYFHFIFFSFGLVLYFSFWGTQYIDGTHLREGQHELPLPLGGGRHGDPSLRHLRGMRHRHLPIDHRASQHHNEPSEVLSSLCTQVFRGKQTYYL